MSSILKVSEIQDSTGKKILQNTGGMLQVKQATNETSKSTSSTSYVSTGLSVDITPTSTSSKILLTFVGAAVRKTTDSAIYFALYKDGSLVNAIIEGLFDTGDTQNITDYVPSVYLDSPATTNQITYEIYWKSASGTIYLNVGNWGITTLTAQEISA